MSIRSDDTFTKCSKLKLDLRSVSNYICLHHIINNYFPTAYRIPPFETPLSSSFPGAILLTKIDKIFFSYNQKYEPAVIRFFNTLLKTYFHQIKDEITIPRLYEISECNPTGSYDRKRTYTSEYDRCNLLLKPRPHKRPIPKNNPNAKPMIYYPPSRIELHDPTYYELDQIIRALLHFAIISKVEIAFDFFSNDILSVYKFLSEHLILDGVRTYFPYEPEAGDDPSTTYLSDTRKKTKKAGTIYIKDRLFVRVEVILSRAYFYENGIDKTFRSFIQNLRFQDYFKVLYFDKPALFTYLSKKLNTTDPNVINKHYDDYDFSHPHADEPLVDTVQKLKRLKVDEEKVVNWPRFLKPLGFPMKIIKK